MSERVPRRGADLYVGRVLGIPIYLGPSWFLVALVLTVANAGAVEAAVDGIGGASYAVSFVFVLLLYASVLVHELGHSLVARRIGLPVRRITLHAFVGLSEIEQDAPTPAREALVAAAGPALSLACAVVAGVAVPVLDPGTVPRVLAVALTFANVVVAVVNLLPGLPLDGGRVLAAGVWQLSRDRVRGTAAAAWAGRVIGVLVATLGFAYGVRSADPTALYRVVVAIVLGAFIWTGASASLRAARVRAALPALRLRELTRPALSVPADLPLAEALRRLVGASAGALVVVDALGRPTAVVSESAVAAVPEPRRPWVAVGTLARAVTPELSLPADLAGADLLSRLGETPAGEYVVLAPDGSLAGVLTTRDVAARLAAAGAR